MAFDYDLFVIGGGSGGVRAARIAAAEGGARVGLAEESRMGGTCVIRGCVPKKLMVFASGFPAMFEDAQAYGWKAEGGTFDWRVFEITTEISKQVFPVSLDTDSPRFRAGLHRLVEASDGYARAKAQGGLGGLVKRAGWALVAAGTFVKLYVHPVKRHELPAQIRVAPAW